MHCDEAQKDNIEPRAYTKRADKKLYYFLPE